MNSTSKFRYPKFLIVLTIFTLLTLFFSVKYGPQLSVYLTFLTWSFFILCIPANHGNIIFGTPIRLFRHKPFFTQPFVWIGAFILNAITFTFSPMIYALTVPTHLLLRMIENPYPCWFVFLVSAIGTMYPILVGTERFYTNRYLHLLIQHIIKIISILTLLYCAHPELVIILNTLS